MTTPKPLLELELRPVAAPAQATAGAIVYMLLPQVDELLGRPGFGCRDAILLPDAPRAFDPWAFFFGQSRDAACRLH
jgi:hypothetical protein